MEGGGLGVGELALVLLEALDERLEVVDLARELRVALRRLLQLLQL